MKAKQHIGALEFDRHPLWFRGLNKAWKGLNKLHSPKGLDKDELIGSARKETGLKQLGGDFREEPLERLLLSLNEEARLSPIGQFIWRKRLVNLLAVRLRAEDWFRRHPEILEQEVLPPMVIAGLQRTGTTKLHRLLAADPHNRVLQSWEALNPAPLKGYPRGKDKRLAFARTSEKALRIMAPGFFAIHPVEYSAPEEDILLLDVSFLSTTPEATAHVPSYAAWLETVDQDASYAYGAKLLRLLQWQHPGRRWVLKSPHHLEFLDLIERHYGQPHVLWTHRNLAECIPSFLSMVCHSRSIFSEHVRAEEVAAHWARKTAYMLDKALEYRRKAGHKVGFTDVLYTQLVKDAPGELERIYARHGGIPEKLKAAFRHAEADNPQGKYGKHEYSHQEFGLDMDALSERNSAYLDLFASLKNPSAQHINYHVGT